MSNEVIMIPKYLINLDLPLMFNSKNDYHYSQNLLGLCSFKSNANLCELKAIPDLYLYLIQKDIAKKENMPWPVELTRENIDACVAHNKTIIIALGTEDLFLIAYEKYNSLTCKLLSDLTTESEDLFLFYNHLSNIITNQINLLKESEELSEYASSVTNCSIIKINLGYDLANYLYINENKLTILAEPSPEMITAHAKDIYDHQDEWYPEELIEFVNWSKTLLEKVPKEYLESAKIEIQSDSIFINYERPETTEEANARIATLKRKLLLEKERYLLFKSFKEN